MNENQKKAIGFLLTVGLFFGAGVSMLVTGGLPPIIDIIASVLGAVGGIFGIVLSGKPQ